MLLRYERIPVSILKFQDHSKVEGMVHISMFIFQHDRDQGFHYRYNCITMLPYTALYDANNNLEQTNRLVEFAWTFFQIYVLKYRWMTYNTYCSCILKLLRNTSKYLITKQILYLDKLTGNEGHLYLDNVMANKNSFILINIFLNYYLLLYILETG